MCERFWKYRVQRGQSLSTDEVCLIGQPTGIGDLRPRLAVPSFREDSLKSRQARKSLRTDAKSSIEGTRKMTCATAQFCDEGVYLRCRVVPEMQRRAAREAVVMRTKMSKQKGLDTSNPPAFDIDPSARERCWARI